MKSWMAAVSMMLVASVAAGSAQQKPKPSGTTVMNEITVKTDTVYTGTMELTTDQGKVTGKLHITAPTDITGNVSGTSNKGVMALDFPFFMTEQKCTGHVKMAITLPAKIGPATGTMEAIGCSGRPEDKVSGTIELKPVEPSPAKPVKN
jgi:hypothetical protein